MNENLEYIVDAFTKEGTNTNLEVDHLTVGCIHSKNNQLELDSEGNLTVKSITTTAGSIPTREDIVNLIYPVGSIFLSVENVNPGIALGGTWTQIKDRFLLACGDIYDNGSMGGARNHTLIGDEMPSHTHTMGISGGHSHTANFLEVRSRITNQASNNVARPNSSSYDSTGEITTSDGAHSHILTNTGLGMPHNNMPPYLTVSMWQRTA